MWEKKGLKYKYVDNEEPSAIKKELIVVVRQKPQHKKPPDHRREMDVLQQRRRVTARKEETRFRVGLQCRPSNEFSIQLTPFLSLSLALLCIRFLFLF